MGTANMISSRSLAFFALMAVVGFALAMPQPEAEAEAEAQRFYGNNYYSSNYGYPSYYRGYNSGYGNNGFYGNNYNNYNNYQGNSILQWKQRFLVIYKDFQLELLTLSSNKFL